MSSVRGIIVFLEPPGERVDEVNRGLLTEGSRLTRLLGGKLGALAVGHSIPEPAAIQGYGLSRLIHVDGNDLSEYSCETFAWAAAKALENIPFRLLLFAHSDRGSELAPKIASYLDTAAVTDCVDIRATDGCLVYVRHVYGGQLEQEISYSAPVPEIASIRTDGLYKRKEGSLSSGPVSTLRVSVEVPSGLSSARPLDTIPPDYRTVDILYARRIVGLGAGCAGELGLAEELAHLLGASIAATRPVVDDGLVPKARMIGQTGKTVAPDLYLTLGVSGSPHHVAGIQESREVLSVNLDPRAPVFSFSDTGFVGDLRSLLPKLIERIKRHRDKGLS
jgi:electron transfer flavoprotein alpha subunit